MILAACIDDKRGMMFNKRRQSRDQAQQSDLVNWCAGRRLWMNSYSAPLFAGIEVCVCDDFLQKAGAGEICFVETCSAKGLEDRIEAVILYRWNRTYPADVWFELDLSGYVLEKTEEFAGASHEVISREIYRRKE